MISFTERMANPAASQLESVWKALDNFSSDLRFCEPGIIQSFNSTKQTVEVKLALRERVKDKDGKVSWAEISVLADVPIVFPRAGDYVLTFPVSQGDECLVLFGDKCMDAWWQNSGVQNQMDTRRHDLSDGFALFGCWSQPNVLPNYSTSTVQLRNKAGTAYYEIAAGDVLNIVATTLNVKVNNLNVGGKSGGNSSLVSILANTINAVSGSALNLKAGGATTIEDRVFLQHQHINTKPGNGVSGPVGSGGGGGGGGAIDFGSFFYMG